MAGVSLQLPKVGAVSRMVTVHSIKFGNTVVRTYCNHFFHLHLFLSTWKSLIYKILMSAFSILIISKNPTASGFLFKLIRLKEKFKKILMAKKCLFGKLHFLLLWMQRKIGPRRDQNVLNTNENLIRCFFLLTIGRRFLHSFFPAIRRVLRPK